MKKFVIPAILAVVIVGGLGAWYLFGSRAPAVSYRTEKVTRGELVAAVSATGTLEPEDVVDVGAQVAGSIKDFGTGSDGYAIDYDSPVEPNMVLARIDDSLYRAKVEQSRALVRSSERKYDQAKAKVEQAKANTVRAQADLKQATARSDQSNKEWDRIRQLGPTLAVTQSDFDIAQANFETNKAGVGVAEAALVQAKAAETDAQAAVGDAEAAVLMAKAALQQDEINLGYCTIRSPVKGTIIDRRVTIGQTVQPAFNTPSLFLIAKDLKRIKVWASVNEADFPQVKLGQPVRFTVDGYPSEAFRGSVVRKRLNATNTQNVVVYTVEVLVDNSAGRLEPYMTANLQFEVNRRAEAVLVPNAALRYKPPGRPAERGQSPMGQDDSGRGEVWVLESGKPKAVPVRLGLTDGTMTEVLNGDLDLGTELIVAENRAGAPSADTSNPFGAPKFGTKKQ
ncbi:MAG TPA: efflux RND transporter periplasmic adaptor subunit [Gemmataceae bacterium]|nr:efflux RND transporter periplasmic adaptor subunit [Gemmataceae bacterium]